MKVRMTCMYNKAETLDELLVKASLAFQWLTRKMNAGDIVPDEGIEVEFAFIDRKENPSGWQYTNGKVSWIIKQKQKGSEITLAEGEL